MTFPKSDKQYNYQCWVNRILSTPFYFVNLYVYSCAVTFTIQPVTRPLLHDPPQSVRLEEDGVWSVAKVLSDVQQARADIDLQCALTEAQEQYTDLGELLQSMEYSEEWVFVIFALTLPKFSSVFWA